MPPRIVWKVSWRAPSFRGKARTMAGVSNSATTSRIATWEKFRRASRCSPSTCRSSDRNFLESTKLPGKGPYYGGSFEFGNNEPHCYVGKIPEGVSMFAFYLPIFAEHMRTMAPKGADVES